MAFNLKKVLKALLFSTNQPLSIKDIQTVFTRFHEKAAAVASPAPAPAIAAPLAGDAARTAPAETAAGEAAAVEVSEALADEAAVAPDLYQDVPSLITAAQIREVMEQIRAELTVADDGLVLIEGATGYRLATDPRVARWIRILRQDPPPVRLSQSAVETLAVVSYRQPVTRAEIESIRGVSADASLNKLIERGLVTTIGKADLPGRPYQYGTTDQFLEFVGVRSLDELPASDVLSSRQIDEWLKTSVGPTALGDTAMGLADEQLPLERPAVPSAAPVAPPESASAPNDSPAALAADHAAPAETPA